MERVFRNNQSSVNKNLYHITVLAKEVVDFLNVKPDEKYIDATLGGGGHTWEVLNRGGKVLGIDADQDAVDYVERKWKIENRSWKEKLTLVRGNFRDLKEIARRNGFEKVAGILFDLGTSRHQLKDLGRGFSFNVDEELDMRMEKNNPVTAKEVINTKSQKELYEIFTKFGEEKLAWTISETIVRARSLKPISKTSELADIVRKAKKTRGKIDAATKVFQALRIYVNDELENLKQALEQTIDILQPEGRLIAISFHSLEDRIVKNFLRTAENQNQMRIVTKKPVRASEEEIRVNPGARSAKMRVTERI